MRNFKLLLATTAILSTGLAMNVKADSVNLTMHPSVTMIPSITFSISDDLSFGNVKWEKDKTVIVTPSYTAGNDHMDTNVTGDAIHYGGAKLGNINMSGPGGGYMSNFEVSFPKEDVELVSTDSKKCGKITDFSQYTNIASYILPSGSGGSFHNIFIGGTFVAYEVASPTNTLSCTGDAEITILFEE